MNETLTIAQVAARLAHLETCRQSVASALLITQYRRLLASVAS